MLYSNNRQCELYRRGGFDLPLFLSIKILPLTLKNTVTILGIDRTNGLQARALYENKRERIKGYYEKNMA